jgi:hypothetical protein
MNAVETLVHRVRMMACYQLPVLSLLGVCLSVTQASKADTLVATFDIPAPDAHPPGSPPWATLGLNLNLNGTISGNLQLSPGFAMHVLCFNVVGSEQGFGISGIPPGWLTNVGDGACSAVDFGNFNAGFSRMIGDFNSDLPSVAFTVSRTGGFSSVFNVVQLSSGGFLIPVDFLVGLSSSGVFAGLAGSRVAVTVPEPATVALLCCGLFALGTRRFLTRR